MVQFRGWGGGETLFHKEDVDVWTAVATVAADLVEYTTWAAKEREAAREWVVANRLMVGILIRRLACARIFIRRLPCAQGLGGRQWAHGRLAGGPKIHKP